MEFAPEYKYSAIISKNWFYIRNDMSKEKNNLAPDNNFSLILIQDKQNEEIRLLRPHTNKIELENKSNIILFGFSIYPIIKIEISDFNEIKTINKPENYERESLQNYFSQMNEIILNIIITKNKTINNIVSDAIKLIIKNPEIKIKEIVSLLNINERTLQRKFKEYTGLNMKKYAMLEKFKESTDKLSLEEIYKNDMKYYDQSNFNKEFKKLSGNNPTDFLKMQRRIKKKFYKN